MLLLVPAGAAGHRPTKSASRSPAHLTLQLPGAAPQLGLVALRLAWHRPDARAHLHSGKCLAGCLTVIDIEAGKTRDMPHVLAWSLWRVSAALRLDALRSSSGRSAAGNVGCFRKELKG